MPQAPSALACCRSGLCTEDPLYTDPGVRSANGSGLFLPLHSLDGHRQQTSCDMVLSPRGPEFCCDHVHVSTSASRPEKPGHLLYRGAPREASRVQEQLGGAQRLLGLISALWCSVLKHCLQYGIASAPC